MRKSWSLQRYTLYVVFCGSMYDDDVTVTVEIESRVDRFA